MEAWKYYRIIRRWRWVIIAGMLAGVAAGFLLYKPSPADYSATATLLVPEPDPALPNGGGASTYGDQAGPESRADSALNLIWSQDVATRVIQALQLDITPLQFHQRLNATADKLDPLLHITATGRTPLEAVQLANTVADTVAGSDKETTLQDYTAARELMERQAAAGQAQLQAQAQALVAFQKANQLDLSSDPARQITTLQDQQQAAQLELSDTEARLASTLEQLRQQSPTRSEPEITDNPIVSGLRSQLVTAQVALATQLTVHTENHPDVIALKGQIQAITNQLNTELAKVVSSTRTVENPVYDNLETTRVTLETNKQAVQAKLQALAQVIGTIQARLPGVAQKQQQEQAMLRGLTELQTSQAGLDERASNARLAEQEAQAMATLSVVDRAATAQPNAFRAKRFVMLAALVLGLLLGLALGFFLEYLDNTFKTPERAEALLGMPALAAIPTHNPPFEEAYRMLRVNLMSQTPDDSAQVIAVTTVKPGAGASTVVGNLARAFAQAAQRTVVVDASVNHPGQGARFKVTSEKGLGDVLEGTATLAEAVVPTDITNLSVLPASQAPGVAGGLFGAPQMRRLLTELKAQADVILLDTSPASTYAATLDLVPLASSVILVIDAHQVPRSVDMHVKAQLERLGGKLIGFVLTRVRPDLVDSYFYQQRLRPRVRPAVPVVKAATAMLILVGLLWIARTAAGPVSREIHNFVPAVEHTASTVTASFHGFELSSVQRIVPGSL